MSATKRQRTESNPSVLDPLRWGFEAIQAAVACTARSVGRVLSEGQHPEQARDQSPSAECSTPSASAAGAQAGADSGCDGRSAFTGLPPMNRDVSEWTVRQLKMKAAEMGLNISGCAERDDLVKLVRTGGGPARRVATPTTGNGSRVGTGGCARRQRPSTATARQHPSGTGTGTRMSMLGKSLRRNSLRRVSAVVMQQRQEVQRITGARDAFQVLGVSWREIRSLAADDRERMILKHYKELSRHVHPDKCPPEMREAATRAFQRLKVAKNRGTSPALLAATGGSTAAAAMRLA